MRRQLFFQERTVYADPAAGYATLAASVLVEVVNDLESTTPHRRAHARLAVHEGALLFWIDCLDLSSV